MFGFVFSDFLFESWCLYVMFMLQVWQCFSNNQSGHKRSNFELLAELEHDAGVSRLLTLLVYVSSGRFYNISASVYLNTLGMVPSMG